ncbi:hypothetical protein ACA910_015140 [Epithemia clementina (nom. ined.)]
MTDTQAPGYGHLQDATTAVCCTCFGFGIRNREFSESSPLIPSDEPDGLHKVKEEIVRRSTQIFHDPLEKENKVRVEQGDIDLVFFDAVENQLEEDHYPVITTSYIAKSINVSMMQPESMLRETHDWHTSLFDDARSNPAEGEGMDFDGRLRGSIESAPPPQPPKRPSTTANNQDSLMRTRTSSGSLRTSSRRMSGFNLFRRGALSDREELEAISLNVKERGYPGQLTEEELAQCILFYREIHKRRGNFLDIVYSLNGIEEEPYAICRFMRATKFDADKMLERLENNQDQWEDAKAHDFYRDIDAALGVPLVLFLQHYPYFYHGNAKNGCPVNYFKAGKLETEALLSMVSTESSTRYFWHIFYYTFREHMVIAKERNPDFVRCESINVVDLKGLSSNQLTSEAVECLRGAAKIAEFFPETLHCMLILNAPAWFAMAWKIIKGFIDARTAKKIEVYASAEKGKRRLAELVDQSEIPSDFGGTSPALDDSIREHCRKPGENRDFYSTLVHVKKTEMKKAEMLYVLKAGETASVRVYTRSTTGAMVSVTCQGKLIGQSKKIYRPAPNVYRPILGEEKPLPFLTEVQDGIQGPGKLAVEVKGMADAEPSRKLPHGNFLIAVEVQKV